MQHAESLMAAEPAIFRDAFGQDETTNANPFQDQSRFPHRAAHIAHGLGRIDQNASFGMITLPQHVMKIDYVQHPGPGQVNAQCAGAKRDLSLHVESRSSSNLNLGQRSWSWLASMEKK